MSEETLPVPVETEEAPLAPPTAAEERATRSALALKIGGRGVIFTNVDEAVKYATACFNSRMLPKHITSPQAAFMIMDTGLSLGLHPQTSWRLIYITKQGRIAIMSKGALAVAQASPRFENYEERIELEGTEEMYAVAIAKAKGSKAVEKRFSVADAKVAGLLGPKTNRDGKAYDGPWQAYPKDMLLARARDRALAVAFAAEVAGVEMETIAEDAGRLEDRAQGKDVVETVGPPLEAPDEVAAPRALPASSPDPLLLQTLKQAGRPVPAPIPAPAPQNVGSPTGGVPVMGWQDDRLPSPLEPRAEAIAQSVDEALPPPKSRRKQYKVGDIKDGHSRVTAVDKDGHLLEVERLTDEEVAARKKKPAPAPEKPADPIDTAPKPLEQAMKECPRCNMPLNLLGDCDSCGWPRHRFE